VRSVAELVTIADRVLDCELAILDINLGRGAPTGVDAWLWLKNNRFSGRIVFLTGHAAALSLVDDARKEGVPVLTKPIRLEQLRALLDGHGP
jgi:hypothetical protein